MNSSSTLLPEPPRETITWQLSLIIAFVTLAAYGRALCAGFVFDDIPQILDNPWIRDVAYIPEMFSSNVKGFIGENSNYYRPMMHLIYFITYQMAGTRAWSYHLVNITLHAAVSVLVFLIITRLLRHSRAIESRYSFLPAFAGGLLFATHPINSEAVIYVSAVPELSFTFFYLLSFYLYLRGWANGRLSGKLSYSLSVAAFFLATLCKETALTLPLMIIIYDVTFHKGSSHPRGCLKRYLPFFAVVILYFLLRIAVLNGFAPVISHTDLSPWQCLINIFPLFSRYIAKLVFPVRLNEFYTFDPIHSVFDVKGAVSLGITAAYLAGACYLLHRRHRPAFFSLLFIVGPLLPALFIPCASRTAFAERYLYLPSIGLVTLAAYGIDRLMAHRPQRAMSLLVAAFVLSGISSVALMKRSAVWKNECTLWEDTVSKSPGAAEARMGLAEALAREGRIDEALKQGRAAVELNQAQAGQMEKPEEGWMGATVMAERFHQE